MLRFEEVAARENPNLVIVYGDVNSTLAAALVCSKLHIPVAHVEAGLRSFDRSMPEEINCLLTDQIADFLFTPSEDADENLLRENMPRERIHCVGDVMIDTLIHLKPRIEELGGANLPERYAWVTLHRPSSVDDPEMLRDVLHPLTLMSFDAGYFSLPSTHSSEIGGNSIRATRDPVDLGSAQLSSFFAFLQPRAALVVTDSGGIQEETTFLGVPCFTLRKSTERPLPSP